MDQNEKKEFLTKLQNFSREAQNSGSQDVVNGAIVMNAVTHILMTNPNAIGELAHYCRAFEAKYCRHPEALT